MAVAFSTDGSSVIEKKIIHLPNINTSTELIEERYSMGNCYNWLNYNGFKRIALQFPDDLLHDSSYIVAWLEKKLINVHLFLLADTSYGSCCVDEVAAEHYSADCIVHFGHACLSPTRRLPVLYTFARYPIDIDDCCSKIASALPEGSKIGILFDMNYHHVATSLYEAVQQRFKTVLLSNIDVNDNSKIVNSCDCQDKCECSRKNIKLKDNMNCYQCGSRHLYVPKTDNFEEYSMVYIGWESLTLTNLMMTWNKCTFFSYNPINNQFRKETLNINKALMKRYYMVEKIKDAKIVGILVGTLGVANYLTAMARLKELLKKVGKKYYTFVVGKLNVAKLANFMEIDIYVYVSCPENSLIDSAEFYRPIVTPFEVELACNPDREWTGEYVTDFQQILPGGNSHVALPEGDVEQTMDISLVTGGVRNLGVKGEEAAEATSDLVLRDDLQVSLSGANNAGEYLASRQWQGLEPQLGKTPVTKAVQGRRGIAIGYEEEPVNT